MDGCLGFGVGETMLTLLQSRMKHSGTLQDSSVEKSHGNNLSWYFVSRSAPLRFSRLNSDDPSSSDRLNDTRSVSSVSHSSSDDSLAVSGRCSSTSSSPTSHSKMSIWGSKKREGRKAALLEKAPFGRSTEYLTVHVGRCAELSEKYVVSRKLLTHPLFQVLLKCSEDEFGEDYTVKKGVAIACDPALFLEVVKAVDNELWCAKSDVDAVGWHHDDQ